MRKTSSGLDILKIIDSIEEKDRNNEIFTDEELRFLYEIDEVVYTDDKRFESILAKRDRKKDLARIFNCGEDRISLDENNVLDNQIYYKYRKFICNSKNIDSKIIPKATRRLYLNKLESSKDLKIPDGVSEVYLKGLTDTKELKLPNSVYYVSFGDLSRVDSYEVPGHVIEVELDNLLLYEKLKCSGDLPSIKYKGDYIRKNVLEYYFNKNKFEDQDIFALRCFLVHIDMLLNGGISEGVKDFCMLHDISILQKNDGTLSNEGLRFLYEMDNSIYKNSKIMNNMYDKIMGKRNKKEDLAYLFNCSEDMISLDKDNVLDNQIYYDGYTFICNLKDVDKISIPKATKVLYLNKVEDIKGLVIPEDVLVIWYNGKEYSREEFLELQKKSMYKFSGTPKVMSSDLIGGSSKEDVAAKKLKPNGFINNTILLLNIVLFGILSFIITLLILK